MCKTCQYKEYKKKCEDILLNPHNKYQRWLIERISFQISENNHVTEREKELIDNAIVILDIKNKLRLKKVFK
jgi:hypothetical protein